VYNDERRRGGGRLHIYNQDRRINPPNVTTESI
jgi:hypothetical protein